MARKIGKKSDERRDRRKEALPSDCWIVFVSMGGSVHEMLGYDPKWKWRADDLAATYR
jgi:hypothetical protein